ncbi:CPBP family intramembrane metalloprotease domain-containing protein [Gordonibacter sp. An230]|uniref:CPBP family intramembrane glutamic endopeptidase n=1 Tax=Gordonibacter sp. An230 TaxID=1965592 RepID=UPI000B370384|nr:CPBP family intramembrane glutamic endopeptidase [Gordonibacter sp. An230]OUO91306.1 CPBP family intramembrane metalloprotease domain-containing protein [Gordonibacter sp. An230]
MKRIAIFLAVTFALTWAYEFGVVYPASSGALTGIPPVATQFITGAAMFFPAIGVLVTRLVTGEGFKNSAIKPRGFKKPLPWFLVAWFGPPALVCAGAAVYFLAFPHDFDPSMSLMLTAVQQQAEAAGGVQVPADMLRSMLLAQLPFAIFLAPALNILTTFGEEWGWRGYLVPKMSTKLRIVPTLLVTGVIWGLWHAPLTAIGHNYGTDYLGWPVTGILAMCGFCIVMGIFLTYVTVRTGSCLAAAIGHGALNGFVSAAVLFSATGGNPFVGPLSTGIVGGSAFIVVAAFMLWDLHRREKAGTLDMPKAGLPDDATRDDHTRETKGSSS